jgi:hypothetical protein
LKPRTTLVVTLLALLSIVLLVFVFTDTSAVGRFVLVTVAAVYLVALHFVALWFLLSRRHGVQRAQAAITNVSLLIITLVLVMVGAEYFVRFMFRDVTTTADNLSVFSKQWLKTVRYNRWDFRERDFDLAKRPGVYRIAVVGDSLTYGQGIPEADRFSNLLEKHLNHLNKGPYEVLNFGLPGAETRDELGVLANAVLPARPDFILLQWYSNDVQGPDDRRHAPSPRTFVPESLRANSAMFYLVHRLLNSLQECLGFLESTEKYRIARFSDPTSPSSLEATGEMLALIQVCKKFDIPLGLVLFSTSYHTPDSQQDFLLERTLKQCQEQKLRCLDTRPVFQGFRGDMRLWANRFDQHPSTLANQLVEEKLMETFGDVWLAR